MRPGDLVRINTFGSFRPALIIEPYEADSNFTVPWWLIMIDGTFVAWPESHIRSLPEQS